MEGQLEDEDLLECPVCLAKWTQDEIDWQECGSCGWPDGDGCLDYDFDDYDFDED